MSFAVAPRCLQSTMPPHRRRSFVQIYRAVGSADNGNEFQTRSGARQNFDGNAVASSGNFNNVMARNRLLQGSISGRMQLEPEAYYTTKIT